MINSKLKHKRASLSYRSVREGRMEGEHMEGGRRFYLRGWGYLLNKNK